MSDTTKVCEVTYDSKCIAFHKTGEVEEVWVLVKGVTEINIENFMSGGTIRYRKSTSWRRPPEHRQIHPVLTLTR